MANVTIRNLDDEVVETLKRRAAKNNRSFEAEMREILSNAASIQRRKNSFLDRARRISDMTPDVPQTDSALLVREDRDR